jgi:hypothetical protein
VVLKQANRDSLILCEQGKALLDESCIIGPYWDKNTGYWRVGVKRKMQSLHRFIAEALIPNPHGYKCINHKDGNKENNSLENLEWCTHSENTKHAYAIGKLVGIKGVRHTSSVPVIGVHAESGLVVQYESINQAESGGFEPSSVCKAVKGKLHTHKGFRWYLSGDTRVAQLLN